MHALIASKISLSICCASCFKPKCTLLAVGGFKMENATDMQSSTVQEVTVEGGFEW